MVLRLLSISQSLRSSYYSSYPIVLLSTINMTAADVQDSSMDMMMDNLPQTVDPTTLTSRIIQSNSIQREDQTNNAENMYQREVIRAR